MQTASDEHEQVIIAAARRGEARAFVQLVQRYQTPVYNLAYRLLDDAAEADDAAQETFVRAYTQLGRFDTRQPFGRWLMSIATHYCIDRLRRQKHLGPSLDQETMQESVPSEQGLPEAMAMEHERADEAQRLLSYLPPTHRRVVVLKYWGEQSTAEIAKNTSESVANVKVMLHRARLMMASAARREDAPTLQAIQGEQVHAR